MSTTTATGGVGGEAVGDTTTTTRTTETPVATIPVVRKEETTVTTTTRHQPPPQQQQPRLPLHFKADLQLQPVETDEQHVARMLGVEQIGQHNLYMYQGRDELIYYRSNACTDCCGGGPGGTGTNECCFTRALTGPGELKREVDRARLRAGASLFFNIGSWAVVWGAYWGIGGYISSGLSVIAACWLLGLTDRLRNPRVRYQPSIVADNFNSMMILGIVSGVLSFAFAVACLVQAAFYSKWCQRDVFNPPGSCKWLRVNGYIAAFMLLVGGALAMDMGVKCRNLTMPESWREGTGQATPLRGGGGTTFGGGAATSAAPQTGGADTTKPQSRAMENV